MCGGLFGTYLFITYFALSPKISWGSSSPVVAGLKDAYLAAVQQSETIAVQKELLVQSNEVDKQAMGVFFPTVAGFYSYLQQATPSSVTGNSIFPSTQSTAKLTATQPLFRGLRDFAALRQKKVLVGAQQQAFLNAARQLFYDVANSYYNVLNYQQDVKNYEIEIEVNQKRLKELNSFVRIGRSQLTDVLALKANITSLEAQLEQVKGQSETAKDILAYLTGWRRTFSLQDNEQGLSSPPVVEGFLSRIEERPDVKAAVSNLQANEEAIPIARGLHFPSADLIGNYYLKRPGVLSDVNWDVQVAISLPIFQGGVVNSQIAQAHSVARQYSLLLSQVRRLAEQEIRSFYNAVAADARQVEKLKQLVEISHLNAQTQVQYYRNGLVTNLDVLQAITSYRQGVRQLDHQRYILKLDTVKLQAASAQRPEIILANPEID